MSSNARPGFSFLVCPDSVLIRNRIEALVREHPCANGAYQRRVFWGDDGLSQVFWQTLTLQSLFGASTLLILRRAHALDKDDWAKLSGALNRFNAQVWPFFCLEGDFERNKPKLPAALTGQKYWIFGQKKGWVWQSGPMTALTVRGYLKDWAGSAGLSFGPGALDALAEVMPQDAGGIGCELAKIELALAGKREVDASLAGLISSSADMDTFAFLNALQQGAQPLKIWSKVLGSQQAGEKMLFAFLGGLAREARVLWRICLGDADGLPSWMLDAKRGTAMQLGPEKLCRIIDLALDADFGVKSGALNEAQALELLVAGLAALFQRRGATGGSRAGWR
jgi:DNA polymerase-3 subunit delta